MGNNEQMRELADESVRIIKDIIINNELVNGDLIAYVGKDESGKIIVIRDLLGYEIEYNLSEVSYIFMDCIDCIGHINKSAYKTVISSPKCDNYEENREAFMNALSRLREIEKCV